MAGEKQDPLTRAVVGTFQCSMQLSQARAITITGHVYSDDTAPEINARVDLYQDVIDRQTIRCDITHKEAQIKAQLLGIEQFRDQLAALRARQQGRASGTGLQASESRPVKLSSQEKQALDNGEQTLRKAEENIKKLEAEIVEARTKLAGVEARA